MSLLSDLQAAAHQVDEQFKPNAQDTPGLLAAFVAWAEHGDEFLKAADAGVEEVAKLLAPSAPVSDRSQREDASRAPEAAPAAQTAQLTPQPGETPAAPVDPAPTDSSPVEPDPAPADAETDQDLEAQISDLRARLDARRATSQGTVVEHQTGDEPPTQHSGWNPFQR